MRLRTFKLALLISILGLTGLAQAQLANIYKLKFARAVFYRIDETGQASKKPSVAPAGSHFKFVSKTGASEQKIFVTFTEVKGTPQAEVTKQMRMLSVNPASSEENAQSFSTVVEGDLYQVPVEDLPEEFYKVLSGFDWGTLAVPFKLQLSGGKITPGASVGLYAGYLHDVMGLPATVAVSFGLAMIPITGPVTVGTTTNTVDTRPGLTLGLALVAEPVSQFQIGLVVGWDHTGEGRSVYPYEDKWWASVSIGTTFLRR